MSARVRLCLAAIVGGAVLATSLPVQAQSVCADLWYRRNQIYKAGGYCFKSARAIRTFGNAGCQYDVEGAVPLSHFDRAEVQRIIAEERALGCRY